MALLERESYFILFYNSEAFDPLKVDKLKDEDINKVAGSVFEKMGCSYEIKPGYCLSCGSYRDLEASHATTNKAGICIRRYS